LVQNADDAGARCISFCIDSRDHGCTTLADRGLSGFQGISLLVYNDAIFSEEDFKSIQRIGDSLKKTSETGGKIGRFGIGFNAVYHWTDLPSFVSSKYLVMLDPQARFLPNVNPSNPGKIVDFTAKDFKMENFSDQFSPYELEKNHSWKKPFSGTLFRLPLRTKVQAESSLLSKRHLSLDDAMQLLQTFRDEASAMLLFLKNIERIEIKEFVPSSVMPRVLFSCNILDVTAELRSKRCYVSSAKQLASVLSSTANRAIIDFHLNIHCQNTDGSTYSESWELCNQLGAKEPTKLPQTRVMRCCD